MNKKVFIITCNWNRKKDTLEFIASLKKLRLSPKWKTEIIMVDNGSSDGSVEAIEKEYPQVKIIKIKENLGFSGGFNQGIKWATKRGADYLFLINNDTLIEDPELLKKLTLVAEKDKKVGIVVPKIHFAPGFEYHRDRYRPSQSGEVIWYAGGGIDWQNVFTWHRGVDEVDEGQYDRIEEIDFANGCALLVTAQVIKKIGYFNSEYFANFEDADFSLRVQKAGFKLMYCGETSLWHKVAQSSGGIGSSFHDYFLTRNRLIFGLYYAPLKTKAFLLKEALRLLFCGRRWQKQGIKDVFLKRWGKPSYFFI